MTAFIVKAQANEVIMWSDAAHFDDDLICRGFKTKVWLLPHLSACFGTLGHGWQGWFLRGNIDGHDAAVGGFDTLVERMPDLMRASVDECQAWDAQRGVSVGRANLMAYLAGWSEMRDRFESWFFGLGDTEEVIRVEELGQGFAWAPGLDDEQKAALTEAEFRIRSDADAVRIFKAMRARTLRGSADYDRKGCIVGGFVTATRVDRDGAFQCVVHRWPTDEVGKPLGEGDPELEIARALNGTATPGWWKAGA